MTFCNAGNNMKHYNFSVDLAAVWSVWGSWSDCSSSCGNGVKSRRRHCIGTPANCSGRDRQSTYCLMPQCKF